jgi:hypothetical protein
MTLKWSRLSAVAAARRLAAGRIRVAFPLRVGVALRWRRERSASIPKSSLRIAQSFSYPSFHLHLVSRTTVTMEQRRSADRLRARFHSTGPRSLREPASQTEFGRVRADATPVATLNRRDASTKSKNRLRGEFADTVRYARPGRVLARAERPWATPASVVSGPSGFRRSTRTLASRTGAVILRDTRQEPTASAATVVRRRRRAVERIEPRPRQAPEMVWRTRPRTGSTSSPEGVVSSETTVAPSRPSGRPEPATAVAATSLHPQILDRLAEDVIRRVERRVRIERERRGL